MDEKEQAADPVRLCVSDDISIMGIWHNDSTAGSAVQCNNPRHITGKWSTDPAADLIEEDELSWNDAVLAVAKHLEQFSK